MVGYSQGNLGNLGEQHVYLQSNHGGDMLQESLEVILVEEERDKYSNIKQRDVIEVRDELEGTSIELSFDQHYAAISEEATFRSSPEILRLLVKSNFLGYIDIGRLLLLVSKSIASSGFLNDDIWRTLLVNRFGSEITFQMMKSLQCGPQQCFRHLIKNEPTKPIPSSFLPSDYRIILNLYNDEGERIVFRILRGETFPRFFDDGFMVMKGVDGIKDPIFLRYSGLFKTRATVHIIRISDQKSICLIDDRKGLNEYSLQRKCFVFTTSMSPSSALSLADESAEHLLNDFVNFPLGFYFNLRMKIRRTTSRDRCPDGKNIALYGNLVLEAVCHPSDALFKEYRNDNNGPKFSHILEKLYGW